MNRKFLPQSYRLDLFFFGGLGLCGLHDLYGRIVMSVWCGVPLTFKQPIDCYQFPKMTMTIMR